MSIKTQTKFVAVLALAASASFPSTSLAEESHAEWAAAYNDYFDKLVKAPAPLSDPELQKLRNQILSPALEKHGQAMSKYKGSSDPTLKSVTGSLPKEGGSNSLATTSSEQKTQPKPAGIGTYSTAEVNAPAGSGEAESEPVRAPAALDGSQVPKEMEFPGAPAAPPAPEKKKATQ